LHWKITHKHPVIQHEISLANIMEEQHFITGNQYCGRSHAQLNTAVRSTKNCSQIYGSDC